MQIITFIKCAKLFLQIVKLKLHIDGVNIGEKSKKNWLKKLQSLHVRKHLRLLKKVKRVNPKKEKRVRKRKNLQKKQMINHQVLLKINQKIKLEREIINQLMKQKKVKVKKEMN